MSDTNKPASATIDLTPTNSLLGGSPKGMYVYFLLALCKNYFETARGEDSGYDIEGATAALIAFCPNRTKRNELWEMYVKLRDSGSIGDISPSVRVVGELVSYLSEVLEFEEESTGGLL